MQQKQLFSSDTNTPPLAEILRPKDINSFLGQEHISKENSAILNLINSNQHFSIILWGPPGCGKTTFANLVTKKLDTNFIQLSAVNSGIKELKAIILDAENKNKILNQKTTLFIDEIHRYTKTQQDALLPHIEKGTIYLIGATTENPSFQITPALLSRMQVVTLKPLSNENILSIIRKGYSYLINKYGKITIDSKIGEFISNYCSGDARTALNLVENSYFASKKNKNLTLEIIENLTQKQHIKYGIDEHYDCASALQKSIRGSDANAAIYWMAKMISGGEDPRFIARRLIVIASEDIGISDPNALNIAVNAYNAITILGFPEGRIPLATATIYLANAKKSNIAYKAIDKALRDIETAGYNFAVPNHLKDSHYKDAIKYEAGKDYIYSHNHPDIKQTFLPEQIKNKKYV